MGNTGKAKSNYFYGNERTMIIHKGFCPFHPSMNNLILFEESIYAFIAGYDYCNYCFGGNGHFWPRLNECFQCEVYCSTWSNECEYLIWDDENHKPICYKEKNDQI